MKAIFSGLAALALIASPALAQSPSDAPSPNASQSAQSPNAKPTEGTPTIANYTAAQKIKQDLQNAGFRDVKIVAESFVVQARTKDGDPMLMTIGPHGMSVFQAMNNSSNGSTTGSSTGSTGSTAESSNGSTAGSTMGSSGGSATNSMGSSTQEQPSSSKPQQ